MRRFSKRIPDPRDITIKEQRYIERENNYCDSNGAIPSCGTLNCTFFRRGECWANDYGTDCHWPYVWERVDIDGYVLNRDGWKTGVRIDNERFRIDENGKRLTYATLWNYKRKSKYDNEFVKY